MQILLDYPVTPSPRWGHGKPPHPADRGWKDTVAVYPQSTVVIRPNFDYYAGRYVFHCHASEHSDMSMMGTMEVVA